jgi:hypothetical protein
MRAVGDVARLGAPAATETARGKQRRATMVQILKRNSLYWLLLSKCTRALTFENWTSTYF